MRAYFYVDFFVGLVRRLVLKPIESIGRALESDDDDA